MRPRKIVGLKDIAAALGMSVVSVSNALSGKPGVSEVNRKRVMEKAAELGYVYTPKNRKAAGKGGYAIAYCYRSMQDAGLENGRRVEQRSEVVNPGTLQEDREDGFLPYLAAAAKERGCSMTACRAAAAHREAADPFESYDGLILAGFWPEEALRQMQNLCHKPLVVIENFSPHLSVDYIVSDRYHAAFERTKQILQKAALQKCAGHGRVVFVQHVGDQESRRQRQENERLYGFLSAVFYYDKDRPKSLSYSSDNLSELVFANDIAFFRRQKEADNQGEEEISPVHVLCVSAREAELLRRKCRLSENDHSCNDIEISDCGKPDPNKMAQEALTILLRRIEHKDAPEGVHYVHERLD